MKKYLFYVVIVAILVAIVLVLYFNDKPGTITGSEKNFSISDTSAVTRIKYIESGKVLDITKVGTDWVINRKYPAKKRLVEATLQFLQQFQVNATVPKEQMKRVIEVLNEKSLQVTVEGKNGVILTQYRFCPTDTALNKAWIIMEGGSKPFIASIAGYESIPIMSLFSLDEGMWRDRRIFRTNLADLTMVGLAYPQEPDKSFSLNKVEDAFQLKANDQVVKEASKEAIRNFLLSATGLTFEAYAPDSAQFSYTALKSELPYAELVVKHPDNSTETLKVYQIPQVGKKQKGYDPDRLVGITSADTIPLIIKYINFDPLLKTKVDFVEK